MIKYKKYKENIVVDILSWRYKLLSSLNAKLVWFEYMEDLYIDDDFFGQVYEACENSTFDKFFGLMGIYLRKKHCVYLLFLYMNWLFMILMGAN